MSDALRLALLVFALAAAWLGGAHVEALAQATRPTPPGAMPRNPPPVQNIPAQTVDNAEKAQRENERLAADVQKLQAEKEKLSAEADKLNAEGLKLRAEAASLGRDESKMLISVLAFTAPFLGLIIVTMVQARNASRNLERQNQVALDLAAKQQRATFELKVMELWSGSYSPDAARATLTLLNRLYPEQVPDTFVEKFDTKLFPGTRLHGMQIQLFQELAKTQDTKHVLDAFAAVFRGESTRDWFVDLKALRDRPTVQDTVAARLAELEDSFNELAERLTAVEQRRPA